MNIKRNFLLAYVATHLEVIGGFHYENKAFCNCFVAVF